MEILALLLSAACCAIGTVLALLVLGGLIWFVMSPAEYEVKAREDRKDPKRAWVQGAVFLLTDTDDYAYMSEGSIGVMLEDAWGITSMEGLRNKVAALADDSDEPAWDLIRAMLLLRSAVAMGWLDNETSFTRCRALGLLLQERYDGWDAMAEDLLRSRRRWLEIDPDGADDDGDDHDMDAVLRARASLKKTHHTKIPWLSALE